MVLGGNSFKKYCVNFTINYKLKFKVIHYYYSASYCASSIFFRL